MLAALIGLTTWLAPSASAAPGTQGLSPVLATAYDRASRSARAAGVAMWITSGKRSVAEQRQLWRQALATYGSPGVARRWVLPPNESTHVSGHAIDVGPRSGALWLERNGFRWGLCRTFANEWWHFEVVTVPGTPCPPMWPNAAVRVDQHGRVGI
ncbi:M15 family metallopeptidase [Gordonia sp. NPDC003424]